MIKWPNDIVFVRPPGRAGAARAAGTPDAGQDANDDDSGHDAGAGHDASAGAAHDAGAGAGAGGAWSSSRTPVEGRPQDGWAVLGIGVNVAVRLEELPSELRAGAVTLGKPPAQIEPTLARLLTALARRLEEPPENILDAYRARDALRGRELTWSGGGRGRAEGIDGEGRLVVALADGGGRAHAALSAGECICGCEPGFRPGCAHRDRSAQDRGAPR